MAVWLPTLEEAQTGRLTQVVPANSRALEAELMSAELFAFPLASRTVVVERDDAGLDPRRVALTAERIQQTNRGELPIRRQPAGAYGITNAVPGLPFAREFRTTAVTSLLFGDEFNQPQRVNAAKAYATSLRAPPDTSIGVTGTIPARDAQEEIITDKLRWSSW
jgi:RND superfamily putative drug exporter